MGEEPLSLASHEAYGSCVLRELRWARSGWQRDLEAVDLLAGDPITVTRDPLDETSNRISSDDRSFSGAHELRPSAAMMSCGCLLVCADAVLWEDSDRICREGLELSFGLAGSESGWRLRSLSMIGGSTMPPFFIQYEIVGGSLVVDDEALARGVLRARFELRTRAYGRSIGFRGALSCDFRQQSDSLLDSVQRLTGTR